MPRFHEQAVVEVNNECPPIAHWDPEALFETFSRLHAFCQAKTGGNGLGLAIGKAIAEAKHWTLSLTHDGAGVRADSLQCPRQPQSA
jgi:K+-sensing histidine kinase KdpD